jgi:hypothetical protein
MTLNESSLNRSSDDCSDRDYGVSRREFRGMTAATLLMAGSCSESGSCDKR